MEEQNVRLTTGLSPVYPRFIRGTTAALRSGLLASGPMPIRLCKPSSYKACPGTSGELRGSGEGWSQEGPKKKMGDSSFFRPRKWKMEVSSFFGAGAGRIKNLTIFEEAPSPSSEKPLPHLPSNLRTNLQGRRSKMGASSFFGSEERRLEMKISFFESEDQKSGRVFVLPSRILKMGCSSKMGASSSKMKGFSIFGSEERKTRMPPKGFRMGV